MYLIKITSALFVVALACVCLSVSAFAEEKAPAYVYEDTRQLVTLVEEAATLIEQKGDGAFKQFGVKGSKWWIDQYYIFVYAVDGTCLFHPIEPELIGKNLMTLRDMDGKPVVQMIADIARKTEKDASGRVFYLWPDKSQLTPSWKSAAKQSVRATRFILSEAESITSRSSGLSSKSGCEWPLIYCAPKARMSLSRNFAIAHRHLFFSTAISSF
jgi:hypothetical protein